jgi:carboxyl-terminal processing protease
MMRGTGRTVIALGAMLALTAGSRGPVRADDHPLQPVEAFQYATQLTEIARIVSTKYVRPVSVPDVILAGLRGLFKSAGKTPPADLADRITWAWKKGVEDVAVDDPPATGPGNAADKKPEPHANPLLPSLIQPGQGGPELRGRGLPERGGRRRSNDFELIRLIAALRMEIGQVEGLRGQKAIHASLHAIVESLDPYCAFTVEHIESSPRLPQTNFGLGLEVNDNASGGPPVVKKVVVGGPAQRAGLRPGDQILEVNKAAPRPGILTSRSWSDTGQVSVRFQRGGESRTRHGVLKAEATHAETVLGAVRLADNSWDYWLDAGRHIAQIRLANLEQETATDLNAVLTKLQADGMTGLILDLRWCPGGYLNVARNIADMFIGDYNLAYFVLPTPNDLAAQLDPYLDNHCENATVQYRDGHLDMRARTPGTGFPLVPMIVLVNAESSGGAELIAAVLQDNHRARVLGQRTRGKASVQEVLNLLNDPALLLSYRIEGQLKISNGLLVRPSGQNLNRFPDSRPRDSWGVRPDPGLEFHTSPELAKELHTWWTWQDLRPGDSIESLPLDNPNLDPQRQAALKMLLNGR